MEDEKVYTETMARIYADQGLFGDAARVYRKLLEDSPHRLELKTALEEMEERESRKRTRLAPLFDQWFQLMFSYHQLQRIRTLRQHFRR